MWAFSVQAQNITDPVILRNMTNQWIVPNGAITALRLNTLLNGTYNIIQNGDSVLRAKQVADSLTLAQKSFRFGLEDTAVKDYRYMNMDGYSFYFNYDGNKPQGFSGLIFGDVGYGTGKIFDSYILPDPQKPQYTEIFQDSTGISLANYGNQVSDYLSRINLINGTLRLQEFNNYAVNEINFDTALTLKSSGNGVTSLLINPTSVAISHPNDNIPKNIITSINSNVADSTGNIDIASGGAPMRFGIEDTAIVQDRYMDMKNQQFYYDYDGDQNYNNYLNFGGTSQSNYFDSYYSLGQNNTPAFSSSEIYQFNNPSQNGVDLYSKKGAVYCDIVAINGNVAITSKDQSNNTFNASTSYKTSSNGVIIRADNPNGSSYINVGNSTATITRSNDNIPKNIITSINSNVADSSGNINISSSIAQGSVTNSMLAGSITFANLIGTDIVIGENQVTNLTADLAGKQNTLVSSSNIKTINGNSILGAGDLIIASNPTLIKGTATLSNGTVTITNSNITSASKIFLSVAEPSGIRGFLSASTANAIAGYFVINSTSVNETSTVNYSF